jgi:hypothetical protein
MLKLKPKSCRICRTSYIPRSSLQVVCSTSCAITHAERTRTRQEAKKAKADRKVTRERQEALKSRREWIKDVQKVFNTWVRLRDQLAGHACISSGRTLDWSGNAVDAGHYRSTGSAPHLRFDERNVHAQSKHDNNWKSGAAVEYRIGLIKRIGLEAVEALEADNTPRHYTIDDLKAIKAHYSQKCKELDRMRNDC